MLSLSTLLSYYKREDIQKEILAHAKDREIAVRFGEKGFGKRPDILTYSRDILELAKQGATSFHASEERWSNPLLLNPMMKKEEAESLRIGWDLVIDIDCPYFEYSKIAADLVIKAFKHHNISAISAKFSGNKGFHIGVPFEAFPKKIAGENVSNRFPEDIRSIAFYIKGMIKSLFAKRIFEIEDGDIEKVSKNLNKKVSDITLGEGVKKIDSEKILDIDTILISSRHLYRMPYSIHEKSGLASIPLDPEKILEFKKEQAIPENVEVSKFRFLDRENVGQNQANDLFDKALHSEIVKNEKINFRIEENTKEYTVPETAIPSGFFPPCISLLSKKLKDGKKRGLFILINFLTSCGWDYDAAEKYIKEWNKSLEEPLREVLIVGQVRYHKSKKKKVLPPNCQNQMYYKDIGICQPDNLCSKIKNPVNYAKRKVFYLNKNNKKDKNNNLN